MLRPKRAQRGEAGSVPLAMLAALACGGVMIVLVASTITGVRAARFDRDFMEVVQGADAGVQEALFKLNAGVLDETDADPVTGLTPVYNATIDGTTYEWQAQLVSAGEWVVTSTGELNGVDRTVVATVQEAPRFFVAAFADDQITFAGSNAADSYTSDPAVPAGSAWCTGHGRVGSNNDIQFNGSAAAPPCHSGGRTVDQVNLFDWANNPGGGVTASDPGGDRCNHSGGVNCDNPPPDGVRIIDEPLDLDSTEQMAFIEDALDQCRAAYGSSLPDYRSSVDGNLVAPNPGEFYCFDDMLFDQDTTLIGASVDRPVVIYVEDEIEIRHHVEINCPGCAAGISRPVASTLQIYALDGDVTVGNHVSYAGVLYAPRAHCGGANAQDHIYGSLICGSISNAGGWRFHFDDALAQMGTGRFNVAAWREE